METFTVNISGLVQGVGFRPFIYRLATDMSLIGRVENRNDGVTIVVNTDGETLKNFISRIWSEAPPVSDIFEIKSQKTDYQNHHTFNIAGSTSSSDSVTGVSPDIAVCTNCIDDMRQQPHRLAYPFINCTNCGPRFTIIRDLPYDRENTTMAPFRMCEKCKDEYENISDRRFHAQPVACNSDGPVYSVEEEGRTIKGNEHALNKLVNSIREGKIIALKGMGGYHLLCDARNEEVVAKLRKRKQREGKPFAVMCRDADTASTLAVIDEAGRETLTSWRSPVVIFESRDSLPTPVSNGLNTIGIILPYMPIHHLLFDRLPGEVIIFTSANLSDEPVIKTNEEAVKKLAGLADIIITYNREIHNRADDSVVKIISGTKVPLRRSRGYTPHPVRVNAPTEGIFAAGSELVNTFAIGKGHEVIMSQYIGDLKNRPTMDFYTESYHLFKRLFRFEPRSVACDMHPGYLSTCFAHDLAREYSLPLTEVQHHHAHIASCMAENSIEGEVIGLALDGVGLGDDGNIWGGEVMLASYDRYRRISHFDYIPIMGADRVSNEPWRSALSYLWKYVKDEGKVRKLTESWSLDPAKIELYRVGLNSELNTHYYSGAGRLFDAIAVIAGIGCFSKFHAEAPMRLESLADSSVEGSYNFSVTDGIISFGETIIEALDDALNRIPGHVIASRFHNTVVNALVKAVTEAASETGSTRVALSGGSFQNRLLTDGLVTKLTAAGFETFLHREVPPNDSGIALGQMMVASAKQKMI